MPALHPCNLQLNPRAAEVHPRAAGAQRRPTLQGEKSCAWVRQGASRKAVVAFACLVLFDERTFTLLTKREDPLITARPLFPTL